MKTLLLLSLIPSLLAHDLYLMPQKFRPAAGEKILLSAHTGDSFPGSEQPVDPARLTALPSIATEEWRMMAKATHALVTAQPGGQYFAIWTAPRALEMEPAKFLDYLKEEGLDHVIAYRSSHGEAAKPSREVYSKFAKTYVVAGDSATSAYAKPLGLKIEIVPLADPAALTPGASLPIQVLYNGQPLANTQVELALSKAPGEKTVVQIPGRTNAQGKLDVPIPSSGKLRLHTLQMERVQAADHEWESFWASLTFEVAPANAKSSTLSSR